MADKYRTAQELRAMIRLWIEKLKRNIATVNWTPPIAEIIEEMEKEVG